MQQTIIKLLSILFPNQMVRIAYQQLTSPQFHKLRPHELDILAQAKTETIDFLDFKIKTYTWQGGEDTVLLIHGWEGQAGNFADLIQHLLAANFTVFAFDGPSHGFSSKGQTSLFEFSDLVAAMIKKLKPQKLVSHSFGGVATTFALASHTDIAIQRYALLTTPDKFRQRIDDVSMRVGITEKVKNKLISKLEKELDLKVDTLNVSDAVKKINVHKGLIIHDRHDKVIPISQSQNVAANWEAGEIIPIEGTGHFRILRTAEVLDKVVDFLKS